MLELIKTLREYNNLTMDEINLNLDEFYDAPDEVKDIQGIDRSMKMNVRVLG